jgi:hypothetical protein
MTASVYGSVTQTALAEYFIKRFNMVGRDAEYQRNRPTLSWIPRDTEKLKQGDGFYETVKVAGGWGGTPDWVTGNQYHAVSTKMRWAVTDPYAQYSRVTFDNLSLARNNLGTLIDIKGSEAEDVKEAMLNTLEFQLWSAGSGVRGVVSAIAGTAAARVVTLVTPSDVYNFPHGTHIELADEEDGGTARTDKHKVVSIDPINGKITLTRLSGASDDVTAGDFIFARGASASNDAANPNVMPGIPKFIPSTDPSDTYLGVTRSADPATSGWRFPFRSSISETIQRAFAQMGRFVNRGAAKFVVILSTMDWLKLSMEREGRIMEDPSAMQKWGLTGLAVNTPFGPITCISVPQLGDGRGYIIDWSTWKLYTLKNLPHVVDEDGQTFVRGGIETVSGNEHLNGDFVAMQMRIWTQLLCLQPLGNATFPTVAS